MHSANTTQPRPIYRYALIAAVCIAALVMLMLRNVELIESTAGDLRSPCRITHAQQVAHITVRLEHGELVANCRIYQGR